MGWNSLTNVTVTLGFLLIFGFVIAQHCEVAHWEGGGLCLLDYAKFKVHFKEPICYVKLDSVTKTNAQTNIPQLKPS